MNVDLFYKNVKSQLKGLGSSIEVAEADAMFTIQSTMLAGNLPGLATDLNGININKRVTQKMNLSLDDNILTFLLVHFSPRNKVNKSF